MLAKSPRAIFSLPLITITIFLQLLLLGACGSSQVAQDVDPVDPQGKKYEFDEERAIQRFSRSLQFPTIAVEDTTLINYDVYEDFITFIKEEYPNINEHLKLTRIEEYSLLYEWQGTNPDLKPAMFIGHYDVVPVDIGTEYLWDYPPYSGAVEEGFVWGRGAMDDKSGVMSVMEAAEHLVEQEFEPERTFYIALNHDEEIGGLRGAREIAQFLKAKGIELEFLMDEGSPIAENIIDEIDVPLAMIGVAKKGAVNIELVYRHEGGHSSMPPRDAVITTLSRAVTKIDENPMPGSFRGLIQQMFEPVIPYMSWSQRFAFNNPWLFRRTIERRLSENPATNAALRTTAGVTMFEAGVKENVLPVEGRVVINFRIHPNDTVEDVINYVERTIDNPDIRINVMPRAREPSPISSTRTPQFAMLKNTIEQNFPSALIVPSLFIAGSDSRHFHDLTDNIYRFRPIRATHDDRARVHGINERLRDYNYLEMIQFQIDIFKNGSVEL